MRVYELAKELDLESKELVARALDLGIAIKTASSGLSDEDAEILKLSYAEESGEQEEVAAPESEETTESADPPVEVAEAATPDEEILDPESVERRRRSITVSEGITVQEFAELTRRPVGIVVRELVARGQMAGATQPIPVDLLQVVGESLGYDVEVEAAEDSDEAAEPLVRAKQVFDDDPDDLTHDGPHVVVTFVPVPGPVADAIER